MSDGCRGGMAVALFLACAGLARAGDAVPIADFEADADKRYENPPNVTIVEERAKTGKKALRISHPGGEAYPGLRFDQGETLSAIRDNFGKHPIFCVDVFNPQDFPVHFSASAGDDQSKNYGTRYNDDGLVAAPGWSTTRINLTGLLCSNSNNFSERRPLNTKNLKFLTVFQCPHNRKEPVVLYFDNARLEGHGLPQVEGLRAFDIGPAAAGVFPGFTGVNDSHRYSPAAGFGWTNPMPGWFRCVTNPDTLGGGFGAGDAFVVDLPAGAYVVRMCIDSFGEWQSPQTFTTRTVTINGKTVLDERIDGETFLKTRYLRYEDAEDTPGMDLWEVRVKPALPIRTFDADVGADGKLTVSVKTGAGWPGLVSFLVVYPKAKAAEGQAFMEALDARRKEIFQGNVSLIVPKPDRDAPKPAADDEKRGFITFVRHAQENIECRSAPSEKERGAPATLVACPGEREAAQVGIYPLRKIAGAKVTVSDLAGPGGAKVPASAVQVRKIRFFAARGGNLMTIVPRILHPFETLDLAPGLTRGLWVTVRVPHDAAAGEYAGEIAIEAGGSKASVPVKLTVLPFALDRADDVTISCTGTTAGHFGWCFPELKGRWWKVAETVFRDQAEHGMNAVTGGPGFPLKSIKDGKAEIDFADADRWMDLAARNGMTMRGDAYQGLDATFGFWRSQNKDCVAANEANARKTWGVGFAELIRIVYAEVERHAKEKNWPPRSYYLLDEPRPEFGNVESALELTKLHVASAPGTKFSGYYGPGAGRDPYFKTMSISIAHHTDESLKACVESGKEAWTYTGGGSREDIGRWLFVAKKAGLMGFLRNGYQYVNSDAYYDFSDTEGSWAQVYPSFAHGVLDTVGWERTAQGVNDYRYLKTLRSRIEASKKAGRRADEVRAAEAFLSESLKGVAIHDQHSAALKPDEWTGFRAALARHIIALGDK